MNADFYQFRISDAPEITKEAISNSSEDKNDNTSSNATSSNATNNNKKSTNNAKPKLPDLEPIEQ